MGNILRILLHSRKYDRLIADSCQITQLFSVSKVRYQRKMSSSPPPRSPSTTWNPLEIVESAVVAGQVPRSSYGCDLKYAIILLNQQVLNEELFLSLWNEASFRMLVDGGGNHWRALARKFPDLVQFPHVLCGNFDSIRRETLELLRRHSPDEVEILQFSFSPPSTNSFGSERCWRVDEATPPQRPFPLKSASGTDFTQALTIATRSLKRLEIPRIMAYCETSGRFDQIMANIETLHKYAGAGAGNSNGPPAQLFLISCASITFLLPEGEHRINCGKRGHPFLKIRHCALLPIGSSCIVSTQGLGNDLTHETLGFGRKIVTNEDVVGIIVNNSTNTTQSPEVEEEDRTHFIVSVSTSAPILWDMEYEFDNQLKNVW